MKGSAKFLSWICVSLFFVSFIFQVSCQKQHKEIPVTSYSDEAKQLFIEARNKYEFLHREKAEALLREALEKDPLFAQAHIYRILTCAATDEIDKTIEMALANGILEEVARYKLAKCAIYCELKDFNNAQNCITDCQKVTLEKRLAPYFKDYYSSESLFWKAWIAANQNKFDEALDNAAEYRAALDEMPQ